MLKNKKDRFWGGSLVKFTQCMSSQIIGRSSIFPVMVWHADELFSTTVFSVLDRKVDTWSAKGLHRPTLHFF